MELQPAFRHPDTGAPKSIVCIWVDGASDEESGNAVLLDRRTSFDE